MHRKWVPDSQYQTEKSSTALPVGFSCPVYEKMLWDCSSLQARWNLKHTKIKHFVDQLAYAKFDMTIVFQVACQVVT